MSEVKRYTKIVRTGDGGSAFEDAEIPLRQQQVADGVPPMFAGGLRSAAGVVFLRSAEFDSDPPRAGEPMGGDVARSDRDRSQRRHTAVLRT